MIRIKLAEQNARYIDQDNENLDRRQFIREYTKNGMQADERYRKENPNYKEKGIVEWNERTHGVRCPTTGRDARKSKLCVTDNGIGMSKEELVETISGLGISSTIKAADPNFGVGAKISGFTQNKAGLMIHTFQNGNGLVAVVKYHEEEDAYAFMELDPDGGEYKYAIKDDRVPLVAKEIITNGHGTIITFLGNDVPNDDTTSPEHWGIPDAHKFNKKAWIRSILNKKMCGLPEHLEIRALGYADKNGKHTAQKITPLSAASMKADNNIESHGHVELSNGNSVEWAIMPLKKDRNTGSKQNEYSAHYCCVMEEESYEFRYNKNTNSVLNQCGVYYPNRIWLHFHLKEDFEPNKYRTQIRSTKHDTPHFFGSPICTKICEEFQSKLPLEIRKLQEEEENKIIKEKSNNDYIKQYSRLHTVPETNVSGSLQGESGEGKTKMILFDDTTDRHGGEITPVDPPSDKVNENERVIPNPNKRGKRKSSSGLSYPEVSWSDPNIGNVQEQFKQDMAAYFHKEKNIIFINDNFSRFPVWESEIKKQPWFVKSNKGFKKGDIKKHIRTEVENTLKDAVLTVPTLEAGRWGPKDVQEGLMPISLTVSIAGAQIHIIEGFKRYMRENKPLTDRKVSPEQLNGAHKVEEVINGQVYVQ